MKRLLRAIAYVMAIDFLVLVGVLGWLWRSGNLTRQTLAAVQAALFPPATQPAAAPQAGSAVAQPTAELQALLAKASGHTVEEQVEFLQRSFDSRMAELDLRQRELADQKAQIDLASQQLAKDRAKLQQDQKDLAAAQEQAAAQASDQGFQDSLQLYEVMVPKQVKTIFMSLPDEVVRRYLEAMPPARAGKIIKEFKTQGETDRIQKILERMRQQKASTDAAGGADQPATQPSPLVGPTAAAGGGP